MPTPTNRFRRMRRRTLGRWNKQARTASELHRLLDVTIPVLAASNAFYRRILALMSACERPSIGPAAWTDDSDWRLGLETVTEDCRLKTDDYGIGTGICERLEREILGIAA